MNSPGVFDVTCMQDFVKLSHETNILFYFRMHIYLDLYLYSDGKCRERKVTNSADLDKTS